MIYLASPFKPYPYGRFAAFCEASRIAGAFTRGGCAVFSPVVHNYSVAMASGIAMTDPRWTNINREFLDRCDECYVAKLAGWKNSRSIQEAVGYFLSRNLPVSFVDPVTLTVERGSQHEAA